MRVVPRPMSMVTLATSPPNEEITNPPPMVARIAPKTMRELLLNSLSTLKRPSQGVLVAESWKNRESISRTTAAGVRVAAVAMETFPI